MSATATAPEPEPGEGLPMVGPDGRLHIIRGEKSGQPDIAVWRAAWMRALSLCGTAGAVLDLRRENAVHLKSVANFYPLDVEEVEELIEDATRTRARWGRAA